MEISRREAVRRLGMLMGGALSAPSVAALLAGCEARPVPADWSPRALAPDQLRTLEVAVDLIIPATDTPGAREAGVPAFIDLMLDEWMQPAARDHFLAGLDGLDRLSREASGEPFVAADREVQMALLARLDAEAIEARRAGTDPLPFFASLKEWTLVGYYTSEVGASQELRWLAVPGRYEGDIPLEEVGRTWA